MKKNNNLSNTKKIKIVAIVLSIALLIVNIFLYMKMKYNFSEIGNNYDSLENASLLFSGLFKFGLLAYGLLLIPLVWVEYFLITTILKSYKKYFGLKKWILTILLSILSIVILIFFIKVIIIIFSVLFI